MIKRIVKLTFKKEGCEDFLAIFNQNKQAIRSFPGCRHLELWRSVEEENVFFTYSFWDRDASLQAYRQSALFKKTWKRTKALFSGKAEAWSVELCDQLLKNE